MYTVRVYMKIVFGSYILEKKYTYHNEPVTTDKTVVRVYCPNGHNLLDVCYTINGLAGIVLDFKRAKGQGGKVVLSPTLGCYDKIVLKGELVEGEKVSLFCPFCGQALDTLGNCPVEHGKGKGQGELCLLYLTEDKDPDEVIVICNVAGCHNSSLKHRGEYIHS